MSELNWRREDRRILLSIGVLAPAPVADLTAVPAQALIDTGSTTSGVAADIAKKLQLPRLGKRPLMSAHGDGQIERLLFRVALYLDEAPLPFVFDEVMGFELKDGGSFDALIWMDILNNCDFETCRDGRCRLAFG